MNSCNAVQLAECVWASMKNGLGNLAVVAGSTRLTGGSALPWCQVAL